MPTVGGAHTEDQLKSRITQWTEHWATHRFGTTIFYDRASGLPVGWGGLQHSSNGVGAHLTVGYVIAPDAWGHNFATEIAIASVEYAFNVLGIDALYGSVLSTNAASCRVLEKAGLRVYREVEHDGYTEVVYVITADPSVRAVSPP